MNYEVRCWSAVERMQEVVANSEVCWQCDDRTKVGSVFKHKPARTPQAVCLACSDEPQWGSVLGISHCGAQALAGDFRRRVPRSVDIEVAVADSPLVMHSDSLPAMAR